VIEFAAGIFLLAAVLFAVLWRRALAVLHQAQTKGAVVERRRAAAAAVFDTMPVAAFRWTGAGEEESALGRLPGGDTSSSYDKFAAILDAADAARLADAVTGLKDAGAGFGAALSGPGGGAY